ncbi:hypothetical protein L1987_23688 [Smallanthus sonchifolius]|uniref:Uncharacterized protein n=1 Tax=Smallanthus sonchifolius TaxID=185202 RepID=A0ACB9IIK7_9ASTR|nr:hypothetical protein L1987_23688 [Smallanthus sonchifolius]
MKNPHKLDSKFAQLLSDLQWRFILLLIPPISLLLFFSITITGDNQFYTYKHNTTTTNRHSPPPPVFHTSNVTENKINWKSELHRSRIAVCLVGGARRFDLTGPSIVENVLKAYPNSDLFLNSPLDADSYKFSLLKSVPRIAGVRISAASHVPETDADVRVLTPKNSPNGIQGLLQYFNLVEGCLTMIQSYQHQHNFTYNWIVRTRVDGYWSSPLSPKLFIPKKYVVPSGSSYGGFNDRFGVGDYTTSVAALSRLSMIPELDTAEFSYLNSESAFQAQLSIRNITCVTSRVVPFCIVSDRRYRFPPKRLGVPVAAISSKGPLNGAKCRPCTPVCSGQCAATVMNWLVRGWSWADDGDGGIQLCDARGKWEDGWPKIFDEVVGRKLAAERKMVWELSESQCVADFEEMRRRTSVWEVASIVNVCGYGSGSVLT